MEKNKIERFTVLSDRLRIFSVGVSSVTLFIIPKNASESDAEDDGSV